MTTTTYTPELFTNTTPDPAPVCAPSQPTAPTVALSDCAALLRLKQALTQHLTRIWPTRQKAMAPAAMAGITTVKELELEGLSVTMGDPEETALVVFAPADFEPHLQALCKQPPKLRVHPDTGLRSQGAYVSFETSHGHPPLTLWVAAGAVLDLVKANIAHGGFPVLPCLFAAGNTVVMKEFMLDDAWLASAEAALVAASEPPTGISAAALAKAAVTAEKYSERPWMFMRYELKNGNERLAVNWARGKRMRATNA